MRLEGKVAVITGSAASMRLATACLFLREGAEVKFGDVNEQAGATLEASLPAGPWSFVFQPYDVSEETDVEALKHSVPVQLYAGVGLLVDGGRVAV